MANSGEELPKIELLLVSIFERKQSLDVYCKITNAFLHNNFFPIYRIELKSFYSSFLPCVCLFVVIKQRELRQQEERVYFSLQISGHTQGRNLQQKTRNRKWSRPEGYCLLTDYWWLARNNFFCNSGPHVQGWHYKQ